MQETPVNLVNEDLRANLVTLVVMEILDRGVLLVSQESKETLEQRDKEGRMDFQEMMDLLVSLGNQVILVMTDAQEIEVHLVTQVNVEIMDSLERLVDLDKMDSMDVPAILGKMVTQELQEGMVTLDSLVMMVHQAAQDLMVNLDKEVLRDREVKTGNLGQMDYLDNLE